MAYRIEDICKLGHARVVRRRHVPDQPATVALPPSPTVAPTDRTVPKPYGPARKKHPISCALTAGIFRRDVQAARTSLSNTSRILFRRRKGA